MFLARRAVVPPTLWLRRCRPQELLAGVCSHPHPELAALYELHAGPCDTQHYSGEKKGSNRVYRVSINASGRREREVSATYADGGERFAQEGKALRQSHGGDVLLRERVSVLCTVG